MLHDNNRIYNNFISPIKLIFIGFFNINFSKDLQILTTSRHLVHFNLQISLGLTQIVFLAGGHATHNQVGNIYPSA